MNKADWESLAITRRRIEEIVNGPTSFLPERQINLLIRVVHDAWDHKLSIPDSEREQFDASFTKEDADEC